MYTCALHPCKQRLLHGCIPRVCYTWCFASRVTPGAIFTLVSHGQHRFYPCNLVGCKALQIGLCRGFTCGANPPPELVVPRLKYMFYGEEITCWLSKQGVAMLKVGLLISCLCACWTLMRCKAFLLWNKNIVVIMMTMIVPTQEEKRRKTFNVLFPAMIPPWSRTQWRLSTSMSFAPEQCQRSCRLIIMWEKALMQLLLANDNSSDRLRKSSKTPWWVQSCNQLRQSIC